MSVAKPDKGISAKAKIVEIPWFCVFIYLTVFNVVIAKFERANLPFQKSLAASVEHSFVMFIYKSRAAYSFVRF